jgi:signal transduction histidine kinase
MDTYFAPASRTDTATLTEEIAIAGKNPVITGLLHSVNGLLAIVDERRQVVALNDSLLAVLGFDDPESVLGLRPGEALACVHAEDEPAGCGTTRYCTTCGAAIAMVTSFDHDAPCERLCTLTAQRNGVTTDMALMVKAQPIDIDKYRFLLLFLQDVTRQEHYAALERTFFHDIKNTLHILIGVSDLLAEEQPSDLVSKVQQTAERLINEVAIQKRLSDRGSADFMPVRETMDAAKVLRELRMEIASHPAAAGKSISVVTSEAAATVFADRTLLLRVLTNMAINALEATRQGGTIILKEGANNGRIEFSVWNEGAIAQEIALRVFQRHFSTKNQPGRGIGTYSMKLFGEELLGGKVDFTTSVQDGTVFRFSLPPCRNEDKETTCH